MCKTARAETLVKTLKDILSDLHKEFGTSKKLDVSFKTDTATGEVKRMRFRFPAGPVLSDSLQAGFSWPPIRVEGQLIPTLRALLK